MQYVIAGLSSGGLYAILAVGLVMTYRSTRTLNFAQGEIAMILAFVCYTLLTESGVSVVPALLLTLAAASLLGAFLYNVVIYPNRKKDHVSLAILTVGVQLSLVGLAALVWGPQAHVFPNFLESETYHFLGLTIGSAFFWTLIVAFICMLAVTIFLRFTKIGLAMRVAATDVNLAQLLGVNIRMVSTLAWTAASSLGAVTGVLFSMSVYLNPYMMGMVILKAFAAVVLGGMNSVAGVFVGGLIVGLLEAGVAYAISPLLQDSVSLIVIILVLLVKPKGLFAGSASWRA